MLCGQIKLVCNCCCLDMFIHKESEDVSSIIYVEQTAIKDCDYSNLLIPKETLTGNVKSNQR